MFNKCLQNVKEKFNDLDVLAYYIDNVIIPRSQNRDKEQYRDRRSIVSENNFKFSCQIDNVYCSFICNEHGFDLKFEHILTGKSLSLNSNFDYDPQLINEKLNEIFKLKRS